MMDDGLEPYCPSGVRGSQVQFEPLGDDRRPALRSDAPQPADADRDNDALAGDWQIRQGADVLHVHPRREPVTPRTPGLHGFWTSADGQAGFHLDVIDDKAGRDDRTEMKAAGHSRISDG